MEASIQAVQDVAAKLAQQLENNRDATRQIVEKAKQVQAAQQRLQSITAENQQRKISFEWSEQQSELGRRVDELTEENLTLSEMIKEYQHTLDVLLAKHRSITTSWKEERLEIQRQAAKLVDEERAVNARLESENAMLGAKVQELKRVIYTAALADQEEQSADVTIETLERENAALRSMLGIAQENGNN